MTKKSTAFVNNPAYAGSDNVFTGNPTSGLWNRSTVVEYFARLGITVAVGGGTGFTGNVNAPQFIRNGGLAAQFLKADGSVDSNTYATTTQLNAYLPLTGGVLTGGLTAQTLTLSGLFSGASMTLSANATAAQFIRQGGTSAQFLKADGSVDVNAYLTAANAALTYLPLIGGSLSGALSGTALTLSAALNGVNGIFTDSLRATGFSTPTGTAAQFLKADGSVDSTVYQTAAAAAGFLPLSGGILTGGLSGTTLTLSGNMNGNGIILSGNIASGTGSFTGLLSGAAATFTGLLSGAAATFTGLLTGASATLSGNVLIQGNQLTVGQLGAGLSSLEVVRSATSFQVASFNATGVSATNGVYINHTVQGNVGQFFLRCDAGGNTDVFKVDHLGGVIAGNGNFSGVVQTNFDRGFQSQGSGNVWQWGQFNNTADWALNENSIDSPFSIVGGTAGAITIGGTSNRPSTFSGTINGQALILLGLLTGTSANFSGVVTLAANGATSVAAGDATFELRANAAGGRRWQMGSLPTGSTYGAAGAFVVRDITGAVTRLEIANGGAATFAGKILQLGTLSINADFCSGFTNLSDSGNGVLVRAGGTSGTRSILKLDDALANQRFLFGADGTATFASLIGTGSRQVLASATGVLSAPVSDENLKNIVGKLTSGLDFVLAAAKCTIEFDYKNKDLNAEGFHNWGFGARAVQNTFGKNPAFREFENVYAWDSPQMIAPAYNAIAELEARIKILETK